MKTCRRCGETKPLVEFNRQSRARDGHRARCKACIALYYRQNAERIRAHVTEYAAAHKEQISERAREYYMRNAESVKRRTAEYYRANRENALARQRNYNTRNAERVKRMKRVRYLDQQAERAEYGRVRHRRLTNPRTPEERAASASYLEQKNLYNKAWRKANRERCRERVRGYRARKRDQFVEYVDMNALYERDKGICQICREPVERAKASPDHIVPISRGGHHALWNVQLTHFRCNQKRGAGFIPAQTRLPF